MITEDIKKAIQTEVKKQLGVLKDNDGQTSKENDEVMAMLLNN